jgi:hypothetical protein
VVFFVIFYSLEGYRVSIDNTRDILETIGSLRGLYVVFHKKKKGLAIRFSKPFLTVQDSS